MNINPPQNRLVGSPPKIGIRPAIDGRRQGVRESLEETTMTMARTVAEFLSANLRHANGLPVECVIADSCIGGVKEAAETAVKFQREGVGLSLTVTPAWCYGSETMDMDPLIPKAVWGFNGTERPGAVYLAAVMAAHAQKGLPAFSIYGRDVQDTGDTTIPADVQEKLLRFAKAGLATAAMRGQSYLAMGGVSMGIAGSIVDQPFFERYLGMRVETIDMTEFTRRLNQNIYDPVEYEKALAWTKANCLEGKDYNSPQHKRTRAQQDSDWELSVKMALIARDLMVGNSRLTELGYAEEANGHNALAGGFQGQRQWTDYYPNGDYMEAILTSSFDWNGIRQPYIIATENDALNGVSMLFGHLLTGAAQIFADVRTYWSADAVKRVTDYELNRSRRRRHPPPHQLRPGRPGWRRSARARWAAGDETLVGNHPRRGPGLPGCHHLARRHDRVFPWWRLVYAVPHARWHAHDHVPPEFGAGAWPGAANCRRLERRPARRNECTVPRLYLPDAVHEILNERTNPTWPTTWFAPRTNGEGLFRDVYTVMNNWGANHGAIAYGHIGADLISLAAMLRIPVYMHNVPEEQVFRPHVWTAFGAMEPTGADFRACANFGPLYG
jgi:L-fucose/D-arabinose isomerase